MELVVKGVTRSYPIIIEKGCLSKLSSYLKLNKQKIMIVSDNGVPSIYANVLTNQLNAKTFIFDMGEENKSFDTYKRLIEELTKNKFSRNDVLIALGGGVVGDLALFAGSTYKRGVKVVMVPTTTLSMCDSSVGGKSAINLNNIKNVIGSFYDPIAVFIDVNVLCSLDKKHFYNGLYEALKMGMISNKELFNYFYNNSFEDNIEEVIKLSIKAKKEIVEKDYLESSVRRALNFGHTIGHALESYSSFELLHGEAIGYGMLYSIKDELIKDKLLVALRNLKLKEKDLPSLDELIPYIDNDKKIEEDEMYFVSVEEIGTFVISKVKLKEIRNLLGVE